MFFLFAVEKNREVGQPRLFSRTIKVPNLGRAGTENDSRIEVNEKLINWADLIFVMEKRHKQRVRDKFDQLLNDKKVIILDIEDNYQYMDEELIETLKTSVIPYL